MDNDVRKKEAEIQILKKVFGRNIVFEESEKPDFILKFGENVKYGVEITELYYDETSARIKQERYIKELLEKEKYWHKADKKKLKVQDITYYSQSKILSPKQMKAVLWPKYNMRDYVKSLKQSIASKNEKLKKYCSGIIKNCFLVIYDRENPFDKLSEKEIAKQLFVVDLSKVIRESDYQEIYLITGINCKSRYIPLKAYLLQSDFILFGEFVRERKLINKLVQTNNHPLFAFAEILMRRGYTVTLGQIDNNDVIGKIAVYCGMYGIGMVEHCNDGWGVGIFVTYPTQNIPNTAEFELESDTDFFDDDLYMAYENYVREKIASVGLFFPTK